MGSLCLFFLGCSRESFLVQENASDIMMEEIIEITSEEKNKLSQKENGEEDISGKQMASDTTQTGDKTVEVNQTEQKEIAVHICGAVNQPGVYYLIENQRLYEAVAKAGGFREDADEDYLNQALVLEDGMKVVVPTIEETALETGAEKMALEESDNLSKNIQGSKEAEKKALEEGYLHKNEEHEETPKQEQKIDLNTADETLLCTLPGIGESRAKSIIAYRQEHGPFERSEDVMNVSGIKEAAYEKIKDYIKVSD